MKDGDVSQIEDISCKKNIIIIIIILEAIMIVKVDISYGRISER